MGVACNFDAISLLLRATSKDVVTSICHDALTFKDAPCQELDFIQRVSGQLSVSTLQSRELLVNLGHLIREAVFEGLSESRSIVAIFPANFHEDLKILLSKIFAEHLPEWKSRVVNHQVSLPPLREFDWRVDVKAASDVAGRMSVPTCILNLQIDQDKSDTTSGSPTMRGSPTRVNVELSKETLDTMLDGLVKIRDQLSSVAQH